jgi:hypothetical protein
MIPVIAPSNQLMKFSKRAKLQLLLSFIEDATAEVCVSHLKVVTPSYRDRPSYIHPVIPPP